MLLPSCDPVRKRTLFFTSNHTFSKRNSHIHAYISYLQNYTGTDPHGPGVGRGVVDGVRGHCNRVPAGHVSFVWVPYQSTWFASQISTALYDLFSNAEL